MTAQKDQIDVITNFAVITNVVIKRVHCIILVASPLVKILILTLFGEIKIDLTLKKSNILYSPGAKSKKKRFALL